MHLFDSVQEPPFEKTLRSTISKARKKTTTALGVVGFYRKPVVWLAVSSGTLAQRIIRTTAQGSCHQPLARVLLHSSNAWWSKDEPAIRSGAGCWKATTDVHTTACVIILHVQTRIRKRSTLPFSRPTARSVVGHTHP